MEEAELIRITLKAAHAHIREGLLQIHEAMKLAPTLVTRESLEVVRPGAALLLALDDSVTELDGLVERVVVAEASVKRQIRFQKMWRVLACRACLGAVRVEELINRAFRDFISDPPSEEQLDADLEDVVRRLESFEEATAEFGTLRSIVLDQ